MISLKEGLTKLGFGNMNINEIYGNFTAIRVSQFQDYYDLRATGVADPQTVELLNEIVDTPFQEGESHSSVSTLKEKLKRIGFGGMNINEAYGSYTAKRVSEFQSLYGLKANGIVDPVTESHIDQIYNSPYQNGKEHEDMIKFKEMLNKIGYGYINVNETFGSFSEQKVKEFQGDMELPVSGILDKLTIEKLTEVFERKIIYYETPYDTTVNEQLNLQLGLSTPPQTDLYSSSHGYILTDNLNFEQNGSITGSGVNVRSAPDTTKNNVEYTLARGTTFEYIKNVTGTSVGGNTEWYEIKYKGKTLYVHNSLASKKSLSATVKAVSNIYESKRTDSHTYYRLSSGSSVTVVSKGSTWTEINGRTWRNAKRNDVLQYLDPQKQDDFQHLLLSSSPNVSSSQINRVLDGKGVLDGEGSAFIEASKKHEVNEIYLISHALLETGHGTSDLAKGIEVGENSSGNPVLVNSSNRSDLTNVEEVYNMFGIGAYDGSAKRDGAIRAYKEGWDSVDKAIIGGAKFIGESYIHNQNQQNTLYKMRWNPSAPGYPQYATDMGWAAKQVSNIKSMYDKLDNPILVFDIPKYR
ncbi:Beta-N-acetylglucosaminidase [Gracilibacillus orientalis]|uniref:Beta-N-acetylglucosaminidase n=1 Tax=Gracilibacillus orientalis TaxID=334253 RepID=A0A1I4PI12_9BACI|nr:Beta-N-acetylglucosaminidase [Gracilibacillus orientalis]